MEGFKPTEVMSESRFGALVSYLARNGHNTSDVAAVLGSKSGGRTNAEVMASFNSLVWSTPIKRKKILGIL